MMQRRRPASPRSPSLLLSSSSSSSRKNTSGGGTKKNSSTTCSSDATTRQPPQDRYHNKARMDSTSERTGNLIVDVSTTSSAKTILHNNNNNNNNSHWHHHCTAAPSQQQQQQQQQPQSRSILLLWKVAALCMTFIALGFLQNYLNPNTSLHQRGNKNHKTGASSFQQTSLLTPEQDAALEFDHGNNDPNTAPGTGTRRYHVVFSTDCSPYQHWQSYLVFYTALKVRQTGHVTRIASGCNPEERQAMQDWFDADVQFMSQRFHLQLTPPFSAVLDSAGKSVGDYKFFNKPFGLKYWMEHSDLLRFNAKTSHFPERVHSDVVILIDPDMALLRPLTADFRDARETVVGNPERRQAFDYNVVAAGRPYAQVYGFGGQWSRLDLEKITGSGDTPAAQVSLRDGRLFYAAGPPYLAVVTDMYQIAAHWTKFVPATYEQYPHLLAEMFAYSIAAAHVELPHNLVDSLMVSDAGAPPGGEGWELVDAIPADEVCGFCRHGQDHARKHALPSVLHLCQRYALGADWFFAKRQVPPDLYECDAPLFAEPPRELAVLYDYRQAPGGGKRFDVTIAEAKRHAFTLCYAYALLNEAATFAKLNDPDCDKPNLEKTRNLVQYMSEQQKKKKL